MNNNIYEKQNRETKIRRTVIFYVITAIIALLLGIFLSSIFLPKQENTPITVDNIRENSQEFDATTEQKEIESLIKSYITASVLGEKDILLALSNEDYKKELENKDITKAEGVKFLSNTLKIDTVSISEKEGVFEIKYVLEFNSETTQQNNTIYTIKENNRWKISKLTQ